MPIFYYNQDGSFYGLKQSKDNDLIQLKLKIKSLYISFPDNFKVGIFTKNFIRLNINPLFNFILNNPKNDKNFKYITNEYNRAISLIKNSFLHKILSHFFNNDFMKFINDIIINNKSIYEYLNISPPKIDKKISYGNLKLKYKILNGIYTIDYGNYNDQNKIFEN